MSVTQRVCLTVINSGLLFRKPGFMGGKYTLSKVLFCFILKGRNVFPLRRLKGRMCTSPRR